MAYRRTRPSESIRVDKRIKGEALCRKCGAPAGHIGCRRISENQVFDLLKNAYYELPRKDLIGEKWGISMQIDPPGPDFLKDTRWYLPKGEDANYCYQYRDGWELHIRENDNTGYAYSFHYEPGEELPVRHVLSMIARDHRDIEETFGLYSRYEDPENIYL